MARNRLPSGAISPARTNVLLALMRCYQRDGRATVRSLAAESGLSVTQVHGWHLLRLRDAGLLAWEPNHAGTLRPLVRPVPFGVKREATDDR